MSEAGASKTALKLTIPVNPGSAEAPERSANTEQFEYANPVTLNNRLILYGNAVIDATDRLNAYNLKIEEAKLSKREAERQLEGFEGRLLRSYPPEKNLSTLKLVQAYVERMAFDRDGTGEQYLELREALEKAEDAVHHWQAKAENLRTWLKAIELASHNITTHLSFVKFDGRLGR